MKPVRREVSCDLRSRIEQRIYLLADRWQLNTVERGTLDVAFYVNFRVRNMVWDEIREPSGCSR